MKNRFVSLSLINKICGYIPIKWLYRIPNKVEFRELNPPLTHVKQLGYQCQTLLKPPKKNFRHSNPPISGFDQMKECSHSTRKWFYAHNQNNEWKTLVARFNWIVATPSIKSLSCSIRFPPFANLVEVQNKCHTVRTSLY